MRKAYSFLVPCSVSQFGSLDLRTLHRFIKVFHLLYSTQTTCSYSSVQDTHGWQYGQWRVAGFVNIHRYNPLCGAECFKLPLPPPLAILRVMGWAYFVFIILISINLLTHYNC